MKKLHIGFGHWWPSFDINGETTGGGDGGDGEGQATVGDPAAGDPAATGDAGGTPVPGAVPGTDKGDAGGDADVAGEQLLTDVIAQDWFGALDDELAAQGLNSWSISPEDMHALPPEAQRFVHNVLKMAQNGSDKWNRAAQEALTQGQQLTERERALEVRESKMLQWANDPELQAVIDKYGPKAGQQLPDPMSEEAQRHRQSKWMAEFRDALVKSKENMDASLEKQAADHAFDTKKSELKTYMGEHAADFLEGSDTFLAIQGLYDEGKGSLSWQRCHRLVMGQQDTEAKGDELDQSARSARRLSRPGRRSAGAALPVMPRNLDTDQQLAWQEKNPGYVDAVLEKAQRDGTGY